MLNTENTFPWTICNPVVFRYLEKKYVDAFFEDGSIRLSSFSRFHKHIDEQRLDKVEGETLFVHTTRQGEGQSIAARITQGTNSYVLSTTMRFDSELMKKFGADSYIRIIDTTPFGIAVGGHIPNILTGYEGACLYQSAKIIHRDLGYIDINKFKNQDTPNAIDSTRLKRFIFDNIQHYGCFLKDKSFSLQCEYRFIWNVSDRAKEYLDIKVPEAIRYCEKPYSATE